MRLTGIPLLKLVRLLNACKIGVLGVLEEPGVTPISPLFDGKRRHPMGKYNYIAVATPTTHTPSAIISAKMKEEGGNVNATVTSLARLWYIETKDLPLMTLLLSRGLTQR